MDSRKSVYFGNAAMDQVRNSGWFLGQFVPAEQGPRHQNAVELKWGVHPDGHKRSRPGANGNATTVSILIQGTLKVELHVGSAPQPVTLREQGDYLIFGADVVHSWEAVGHTIVLSVRFPSVEVESRSSGNSPPATLHDRQS
jgi:hypothetical protein